MLRTVTDLSKWFLRYDPGGLRLVRGFHLMTTILVCVALANGIAQFQSAVPAFSMAVLTAAAGSHCLIFTPVSTRRQEMKDLVRMGLVVTVLFGLGELIGFIAGAAAFTVLQVVWIGVIALGFALDGLGGFWQRTGRAISIFWLFLILTSQPASPGLWLPVLAILGSIVAFVVRIGLWRPSSEATYLRVEAANRHAMADHLENITLATAHDGSRPWVSVRELARLRAELRLCTGLIGEEPSARGLSTETATMMELALEVIRDAREHLSKDVLIRLRGEPAFTEGLRALDKRMRTGDEPSGSVPDSSWASPDGSLEVKDQFQILRMAQALRRLWLLAGRDDPIPAAEKTAQGAKDGVWWRALNWRLAVQGGVSAMLGIAIGAFFELGHAYWVTLTIVVILCNNLGATVQKTVQRVGGTAAGVIVAITIDPVFAGVPEVRLALIVLCIPAIIVFMDRNYAVAAGIISFMVIVGLQTIDGLPVGELWVRLWDTLIGAGVGLSVAWVLFPNRSGDTIRALTSAYLTACQEALRQRQETGLADQQDFAKLRLSASNLVKTARSYRAELAPWSSFSETTNDLDVLVIVLGHYVILYRQARAAVQQAAAEMDDASILTLVARMDARVDSEISAVLEGREKQKVPGLADEWRAAMPEAEDAGPQLMVNWVAMLYHARKIIRCLDGLRQDGLMATSKALAPPISAGAHDH